MVHYRQSPQATVIELLPNRSASWAETRLSLFVICSFMLVIGAFWTIPGAWMILPFSILEAGLVAFLLYRVCLSTYQMQIITFSQDRVLVEFGRHFPKRSWNLERNNTFLIITEPRHPFAPQTINICDGRQNIELGVFLNKEDKTSTLEHLRAAGLHIRKTLRLSDF